MGSTGALTRRQNETVKRFDSVPESGHEYPDDKGATAKWFKENSNFEDVINEMDAITRSAFFEWSRGYMMDSRVWGEWKDLLPFQRENIQLMNAAIDKSIVNKTIEVARMSTWRIINNGENVKVSPERLRAMEGELIYVKGAMSTAAAKEGLSIDWRGKAGVHKPVEYKITIPGGSKGAGMWIGDKRVNGWGDIQREFIMNRDSYYKVGKSYYDSERKKTIVELTWMGTKKHEYN